MSVDTNNKASQQKWERNGTSIYRLANERMAVINA